jgi:hypothetical protein
MSNVVSIASGDVGASIQDNVAPDAKYGDVHVSRCREFFLRRSISGNTQTLRSKSGI